MPRARTSLQHEVSLRRLEVDMKILQLALEIPALDMKILRPDMKILSLDMKIYKVASEIFRPATRQLTLAALQHAPSPLSRPADMRLPRDAGGPICFANRAAEVVWRLITKRLYVPQLSAVVEQLEPLRRGLGRKYGDQW